MGPTTFRRRDVLAALAALGAACGRPRADAPEPPRPAGPLRVVFKHQPLWGDPAPFRALLARYERDNPGVALVTEPLPNASDVLHQYYLTALEGGSREFDVMVVDVVWVAEFARAGWIADLSSAFAPARLAGELFPGVAEAVLLGGRTYAVPWYLDTGVLYYRTDLVPRAPRTYDELVAFALEARRRNPALRGYVWQGKQYEGLVCNAYEAIWGHGGVSMNAARDRLALDQPAPRRALSYLRGLLTRGVSPPSVTSSAEEECRRVFQDGGAVFMRNWPYAWAEAQNPRSPVRGRVGLCPLPVHELTSASDSPGGAGALGGYQLALNARTPAWRREAALRLIAHLTSHEASVQLALAYGRNPPRPAVYDDPRVRAAAPFIAQLAQMARAARPRPVTPYYPLLTDALQGEFSAAVAGVRTPEEALRRAQAAADRIMAAAQPGGGVA